MNFGSGPVETLLGTWLSRPGEIVRDVAITDDMLRYALAGASGDLEAAGADYMAQGLRVHQTVRQVVEWSCGGWSRVEKVLDFAAGYGRVTRMLLHDLPREKVWASEIDPAALGFLREKLGVRVFPSSPDPAELECEETFDLVLVSSLFSHLPEGLFEAWLRRLAALLRPEGVLAFSVHDVALLPAGTRVPRSGIVFVTDSESSVLDRSIYGSSWVTERFVRRAADSASAAGRCLRVPRGHNGYQDLYLLLGTACDPSGPPDLDPGPEGHVDIFRVDPTRDAVVLGGWAVDRVSRSAPRAVEAHLDGVPLTRVESFGGRADVHASEPGVRPEACGFEVTVPFGVLEEHPSPSLLIEATSVRGSRSVLFAGSLPALELKVRELRGGPA